MLLLRTCDKEGRSHKGYQYPGVGQVAVAEDWDPTPRCGGGLHGLPNGQGTAALLDWGHDAVWQVLDTEGAPWVACGGKAKCQSAREVYRGDRAGALAYLREHGVTDSLPGEVLTVGDGGEVAVGFGGEATAGACGYATAGDGGHATAGDRGHATAGYNGKATAGDGGHATAGTRGHATAGDCGHAMVGDGGTATAGDWGKAMAGNGGQAMAGYDGHATVGSHGTATAGDDGHATAGHWGTAMAGDHGQAEVGHQGQATAGTNGKARAGHGGQISIYWGDRPAQRRRQAVGYVGEDGIEPDTWYECNEDGQLVAVKEEEDAA